MVGNLNSMLVTPWQQLYQFSWIRFTDKHGRQEAQNQLHAGMLVRTSNGCSERLTHPP